LRDRLEGMESVELFPEVREVLDTLRRRGLKLGVLSDGWASTIQFYERLGLAGYFQSWTFSAVVGCCKPDPRIYAAAERDLGVEPARILFVDDLPANIEGALRGGWQAVWLNRAGDQPAIHPSQTIRNLRELTTRYCASLNT
jgi:HAD superfamily hydrolase (TIGR01509 family)